ncbi:hypothetical protein TNCV_2462741 [Trichonephila clavipes]|nr:hypothetical protein TNCV_2462741 [Trichonephila clavipes]
MANGCRKASIEVSDVDCCVVGTGFESRGIASLLNPTSLLILPLKTFTTTHGTWDFSPSPPKSVAKYFNYKSTLLSEPFTVREHQEHSDKERERRSSQWSLTREPVTCFQTPTDSFSIGQLSRQSTFRVEAGTKND